MSGSSLFRHPKPLLARQADSITNVCTRLRTYVDSASSVPQERGNQSIRLNGYIPLKKDHEFTRVLHELTRGLELALSQAPSVRKTDEIADSVISNSLSP